MRGGNREQLGEGSNGPSLGRRVHGDGWCDFVTSAEGRKSAPKGLASKGGQKKKAAWEKKKKKVGKEVIVDRRRYPITSFLSSVGHSHVTDNERSVPHHFEELGREFSFGVLCFKSGEGGRANGGSGIPIACETGENFQIERSP